MLFLTTPTVVFVLWHARGGMSASLRQPMFLFNAFAIGLHSTARFSLVSAMVGNPADGANQSTRLRPWIRWTGWPVIAGLVATSLAIAFTDEVLAAIVAVLAMGGVACVEFLDPAVERAAFPQFADRSGR